MLAKILKDVMKGGRYSLGAKEVAAEMKSAKVVIAASSLSGTPAKGLLRQAESNHVPVVWAEKNSSQLGRMIGRPFRVSAIGVRTISEVDLKQIQA